jgi:hypothetical protein
MESNYFGRKSIHFVLIMLNIFLVSAVSYSSAQSVLAGKGDEDCVISQSSLDKLREGSISEKAATLERLNAIADKCPFTKYIKDQIISLAEVDQKKEEYLSAGEAGELYISQLTKALGNTHDPRAVPYLMKFFGGGMGVDLSLVKIGNAAIDPLLLKLSDDSPGYRSSAALALSLFLKPNQQGSAAKGEEKDRIKEALIKEWRNPRNQNPERGIQWYEIRAQELASVRQNILRSLGYLAETGDKDVIPIIESIAKDDPYYLDMSKKKDYTGPEKRYTVREEAKKILERLKTIEPKK